jgi:hypothetical protein
MRSGAQRHEAVLREFPPHPGERLATGAADLDDSPVNRHPAERAVQGRTALDFERSKESAALKGGPETPPQRCILTECSHPPRIPTRERHSIEGRLRQSTFLVAPT